MTRANRLLLVALTVATDVFAAGSARGQACTPMTFAVADSLAAVQVSRIDIVTTAPDKMPGPAGALESIHFRTSEETIRRQLAIHEGDSFDPVRAVESVHRLRRLPYLVDAQLELSECTDTLTNSRSVRLRFVTRDAWSTRPTISIRSSASAIVGLEERNLMGTGRSAKVYLRSDAGRTGVGLAYSDPWLFNSSLAGTASRNVFRDGSDWRARLTTRQRSIFDRWNADLSFARSAQIGLDSPDTLRRFAGRLTVSHLWHASATAATSLITGVETERSMLDVMSGAEIAGPRMVNRNFVGLDLGVSQHSALYQVVNWYLPGGSATDFPVGFETEAILGVGRDLASSLATAHVNLWGGRIWVPRPDLFATTDVWLSGYVDRVEWRAGTRRAAVSIFKEAPRGLWTARVAGEQLIDPDPDVRALATLDPTMPALPKGSRLAETAVSASLERAAHLFRFTRGYVIDGAMFGAVSSRWDPAASVPDRVSLGVLGVGLRLTPTHLGRAALRFDVGYPVSAPPEVRRRVFVGLSLVPWIEAGRSRQSPFAQ